jgi:hypothetical protein
LACQQAASRGCLDGRRTRRPASPSSPGTVEQRNFFLTLLATVALPRRDSSDRDLAHSLGRLKTGLTWAPCTAARAPGEPRRCRRVQRIVLRGRRPPLPLLGVQPLHPRPCRLLSRASHPLSRCSKCIGIRCRSVLSSSQPPRPGARLRLPPQGGLHAAIPGSVRLNAIYKGAH